MAVSHKAKSKKESKQKTANNGRYVCPQCGKEEHIPNTETRKALLSLKSRKSVKIHQTFAEFARHVQSL